MKKTLVIFIILISCACQEKPSFTDETTSSSFIDQQWAMHPIWEDGQAEVAIYEAEMKIYGQARKFDNPIITVKEEFNEAFNVKTDDYQRKDLFSVMKVNRFADIETPNYPYHYLTSLFFKRNRPEQLHKMTHSGQEWCGNTFKQLELSPSGYQYDYNSYFDGYGDGQMEIKGNEMWWEDQLPYVLRALKFKDDLQFKKMLMNSQINTKTYPPQAQKASFTVTDLGDLWQVEVQLEQGQNRYLFDKDYPHIMVQQMTWYGYHMKLKKVSRYKYWR
jgi:hypothetical protein